MQIVTSAPFKNITRVPHRGQKQDSDLSGGTSLIVIRGNVRHKLR